MECQSSLVGCWPRAGRMVLGPGRIGSRRVDSRGGERAFAERSTGGGTLCAGGGGVGSASRGFGGLAASPCRRSRGSTRMGCGEPYRPPSAAGSRGEFSQRDRESGRTIPLHIESRAGSIIGPTPVGALGISPPAKLAEAVTSWFGRLPASERVQNLVQGE